MNSKDQTQFNQAIQLAQSGQKQQAHEKLKNLAHRNQDINLLIWLAFTAPNLDIAARVLRQASAIDPNNPNLASAKDWLKAEQSTRPSEVSSYLEQPTPPAKHEVIVGTCKRCQKNISVIRALTFNRQTGRCNKCENENRQALSHFRKVFLNYCEDGILTDGEWQSLVKGASQEKLDKEETLNFIRGDALLFLDRTLTMASADGEITQEGIKALERLKTMLGIPDAQYQSVATRLAQLINLSEIKKGKLPLIRPSVHLEAGEICHLEMVATYHKINAKSITKLTGRVIATSRKLHFLSLSGGTEINWTSVMRGTVQNGGLYLELTKKIGNGFYSLPDPWLAQAVIETLVRMNKRELIVSNHENPNRRIPQNVKIAVWNRDGGRCVECGATDYLEYDHDIPFSKGGANSVGNIRLLCRRCNLKKGDRI